MGTRTTAVLSAVLLAVTVLAAGCDAAPSTTTAVAAHAAVALHGTGQVNLSQEAARPPCGWPTLPRATYDHVVWIWLENRSYETMIGGPGSAQRRQAPYFNRLADECGLATDYHNISHPSQPNYVAAVAGTTGDVTTNCEPSRCSLPDVPTLFTQLTARGRQWRAYDESMERPCLSRNDGRYVDRHNPEVYFPSDTRQCRAWDQPLGTATGGPLMTALRNDTLPAFSFITPNVCSDMHSCSTREGDDWLARWVPRIVTSPVYQQGTTALFITFDEGEHGHTSDCAENTTDVGCHVATIVVAPQTPRGARSAQLFNHYSLLKTTEALLGIGDYLGHANDADTRSMVSAFRL